MSRSKDVITTRDSHVQLYVPPGAASFVSIYIPNVFMLDKYDLKQWSLSVPFDHPELLLHALPFLPRVSKSGYVCFRTKVAPPEVDVRPASYRWLIEAIEENKVRNRRDTAIFEAHALELELETYHWVFHGTEGTSYRLIKVTILRDPGDTGCRR